MSRVPASLDPQQPRVQQREFVMDALVPGDLPRLRAESLEGHPLHVAARFEIRRGALGELRLSGTIEGELWHECQRCLQPMAWHFRLTPDAVLVPLEGSIEGLDAGDDFVELDAEGLLRPRDWVEEEVLLAWPLVPRHEDCNTGRTDEFAEGEGRENPFAVLAGLKDDLAGRGDDS
ncbi:MULTISPECIES: YceD family protein [Thioalkalivibrio]|uniref:Large ribosomal RNA subunit accumulation protein YceD n=1 Tax=Thioalkalivibrio halophilus TaxID=252474 RepID=A0A1V3A0L5_9GAMM|nr:MULTISPECIES: YceD family protein [Thioalkalivibrio]OOC10897.1 metal-binding protein [Thioalkalivibrio halophilus]